MKLNSIRFKISVLYVSILGAILIIYSIILYLGLRHTLYVIIDDGLKMKVQNINTTIESYLDQLGYDQNSVAFAIKRVVRFEGEHPEKHKIELLENKWQEQVHKLDLVEDYINFIDNEGKSIIDSNDIQFKLILPIDKNIIKKTLKSGYLLSNIRTRDDILRMISMRLSFRGKGEYIIQVGTSLKHASHILRERLILISIIIPIILFIAGFIGQLFASKMLKPVFEITKTARNITHENLNARVKAEQIDIEMRYLVDAFNDMIDRLERSFNFIIEFSTYIAHELKTPLAIIIGESEVSLRREQEIEEYKRVIKVTIEEADRMLKIINDLLLLARLDNCTDAFNFEQIDLSEFIKEIFEQTKILAAKKGINVTNKMPDNRIIISADRLHLRRLFFNIIDNAIKFTSQNGSINITTRSNNNTVKVTISDTGCGIKKEDIPKIFQRFFRADQTESTGQQGAGLGLNIALSIAKIHNGRIYMESEWGNGSSFTVELPIC